MLADSSSSKKRYLSNSQRQVTQGLRKKQKVKVKIENDRKEVKTSRQLATRRASEAKSRPEVKRRRTGAKLHTCVECGYTSTRKSHLAEHMRTHTGVKPFRCDECEYACADKDALTVHMQSKHGHDPN